MNDISQPLVSIITPVYNTEKYLAACIESVIAQTYENWEYVIANNCSTDKSLAIAQKYADQDKRIRVYTNEKFLNLMPNWNHAMQQVPSHSKYCKVVHADDWLFPECLESMVAVAEAHPTVGIVSSYRLDENQVNLDGLPYPSTFVSGSQICRQSLLGGAYLFGSPTSLLIRSDLIRKRRPFYDETNTHADKEICFALLQESDFGFVHQVLTFTRRHNEAETTTSKRLKTYRVARLKILKKYGLLYLDREGYDRQLKRQIDSYHTFLVKSFFKLEPRDFFSYHAGELTKLGIVIRPAKLLVSFIKELLNPLATARAIILALKSRPSNKKAQTHFSGNVESKTRG